MTRLELVTIALRTVGDTSLTAEAAVAIDIVLEEIENLTNWWFLEKITTYQTENNVSSVAFSASKWPAAALTDYSKGMEISSVNAPYNLIPVSKHILDALNDGTSGNPRFFALYNEILYLFPIPTTGSLPLLTIKYYKNVTLPTADGDVIETVVGINKKYLPFIISGLISYMTQEEDDTRDFRSKLTENLKLMLLDNISYYRGSALGSPR
jgi:hypothetical protein